MKTELTKGDVYIVVDTPKKAKRLKNLLDMFGEPIFTIPNNEWSSHNGIDYGWGYGFSNELWQGFFTKSIAHNGKEFKKVSIKKLRNILAKDHLISGEYIVATIGKIKYLVEFERVGKNGCIIGKKYLPFSDFGLNVEHYGWGGFDYFDRYATPEEIALLKPKEVEKFAELKEAHRNGKKIECRLRYSDCTWIEKTHEGFLHKFEYRIKPEEIKDSDIATIEALHDVLLDNHKYDLNSKLLTNARELCKKLQNIVGD